MPLPTRPFFINTRPIQFSPSPSYGDGSMTCMVQRLMRRCARDRCLYIIEHEQLVFDVQFIASINQAGQSVGQSAALSALFSTPVADGRCHPFSTLFAPELSQTVSIHPSPLHGFSGWEGGRGVLLRFLLSPANCLDIVSGRGPWQSGRGGYLEKTKKYAKENNGTSDNSPGREGRCDGLLARSLTSMPPMCLQCQTSLLSREFISFPIFFSSRKSAVSVFRVHPNDASHLPGLVPCLVFNTHAFTHSLTHHRETSMPCLHHIAKISCRLFLVTRDIH
ncbi:hypothetical protein DFH27DRAFT_12532 [Peziza echinospora]|nr:hypothetical protein DFH27DRAFT_12532 [Peziza echinospora]